MYHFRFQHVHRLKSFGMPGGWQVSMKVMLRALDSVSAGDLIDPDSDQWSPGPAGSLQLVIRLESNRVAHLITPCTNSVTELRYSRFFLIDAIDWKLFLNYRCHIFFGFFCSNSKPNLITMASMWPLQIQMVYWIPECCERWRNWCCRKINFPRA